MKCFWSPARIYFCQKYYYYYYCRCSVFRPRCMCTSAGASQLVSKDCYIEVFKNIHESKTNEIAMAAGVYTPKNVAE